MLRGLGRLRVEHRVLRANRNRSLRDAKRAKLLDVKYVDYGDRVFYVGTGDDETTQKASNTRRIGTR
jgi:hypothetical protein